MSKTLGGYIRTIALIVMITTVAIADGMLYWFHQWFWATFWSCIILLVGGYEIFAYATKHKTISTMYKEFTEAQKLWARIILALLTISLMALCMHLAVW